jgi:molybdopterin molybdotransferase
LIEPATLEAPLPAVGGREDYVRAIYADGRVCPLPNQDSGALSTLAQANALIIRVAGAAPAPVDEIVNILRIA